MTATTVLRELKSLGSEPTRKTYRRHGVTGEVFGVSYADFGRLKKRIKVDHGLAKALWASKIHDARILATMVADPVQLEAAELEAWVRELDNYILTDAFARLTSDAPGARERAERWSASGDEWIARAGWLGIGRLALNDAALPDDYFEARLATIEREIHHRQNRVRDAMNSALISIGIRKDELRKKALAAAARIGKVVVDHGDTGCTTPDAAEYIRKVLARRGAARKGTAGKRVRAPGG